MYKRFCQRSQIKIEREWHYIRLADLRVVGAEKQSAEVTGACVESEDNAKKWNWKNEIAATMGFGRNECSKRPGLRLRSPQVRSLLCDGELHTPFPGPLCPCLQNTCVASDQRF